MERSDPTAPLALDFMVLNEHLTADGDMASALHRLVELAVASIPGCDFAAVTLWESKRDPRTLAASHETALAIDRVQYRLKDGPCLRAAENSLPVHIPDLAADRRWPRFSAAVLRESPVREVLASNLATDGHRCALNLYGTRTNTMDADGRATAALFSAHARVLLAHAGVVERAAGLTDALTTSRQIGTAVGILMQTHKITADEAFEMLAVSSSRLNRKLRDVAGDVAHTGAMPEIGVPDPSS